MANLRDIASRYPDKVARGLYEEAEIEMLESKRRCPVRYGVLRASGTVHEPEIRGRNISVTMSYGGPGSGAEDYAIPQHENLEFFHTVGEAKFLESVLNESEPYMAGRVARRVRIDER